MQDVVPVKQIGDCCRLRGSGRLSQIEGEIEIQTGPAIGSESARVVGVGVILSPDVVAPRVGVFGARSTVIVVPAVLGSGRVRGAHLERARALVRVLQRRREYVVAVVEDPIRLGEHLPTERIDVHVPPVLLVELAHE